MAISVKKEALARRKWLVILGVRPQMRRLCCASFWAPVS